MFIKNPVKTEILESKLFQMTFEKLILEFEQMWGILYKNFVPLRGVFSHS